MKILYLTPWFPSHRDDQEGNFILDSVESLVNLGHEVTVLVTPSWKPRLVGLFNKKWVSKKIKLEQFSEKFNLYTCKYLSIPRGYWALLSFWFYRKQVTPLLEKLIKKYNCQLIHAHTEIAGLVAVDIGSRLQIPTVVTVHGISTDQRIYTGKIRKLLFEYTLSNTDRVILVGKPLVNFSKQFVTDQDHFRIVWNGFRISEKNTLNFKERDFTSKLNFISVSNLQEGKGIDINLQALARLKSQGIIHWTYKIIGDGDEREKLELLTRELDLNGHVNFIGACDHNVVYFHLAYSDVFILPSYREAFGVAYLEAMSCGLLTIGVKGQGPEAFIQHEKTGLLVTPNNIDDLFETMKNIFTYRHKMCEIANNGKEYVHQHFTWDSHGKELEKVYKELIK